MPFVSNLFIVALPGVLVTSYNPATFGGYGVCTVTRHREVRYWTHRPCNHATQRLQGEFDLFSLVYGLVVT